MLLHGSTIEIRMLGRKRRMHILKYKKASGYKRILSFRLNAQEAKTGQPLAPILGQVQIPVMEFVNYFNDKTKDYPKGLNLQITLYIKWDKTYFIEINNVSLTQILKLFLFPVLAIREKLLSRRELESDFELQRASYFISLINFNKVSHLYSKLNNIDLYRGYRIVLGTLNSLHIVIIDEDKNSILSLQKLLKYIPNRKLMLRVFGKR